MWRAADQCSSQIPDPLMPRHKKDACMLSWWRGRVHKEGTLRQLRVNVLYWDVLSLLAKHYSASGSEQYAHRYSRPGTHRRCTCDSRCRRARFAPQCCILACNYCYVCKSDCVPAFVSCFLWLDVDSVFGVGVILHAGCCIPHRGLRRQLMYPCVTCRVVPFYQVLESLIPSLIGEGNRKETEKRNVYTCVHCRLAECASPFFIVAVLHKSACMRSWAEVNDSNTCKRFNLAVTSGSTLHPCLLRVKLYSAVVQNITRRSISCTRDVGIGN